MNKKNKFEVIDNEKAEVNVDMEAKLREQLEAEIRAQIESEMKVKLEQEEKARKEAEEKLINYEKSMEKELEKQEKSFKNWLDEQPKVSIEIPEDPNNPNEVVPVGLNGVIYAIPTCKQFDVPKPIYDIWKYSHEETKKVNKRIRESVHKEIKISG